MDISISELNYNSVETIPGFEARAAFTVNSGAVFREDVDIISTIVDENLSFMPWGGDNLMPFNIIDLIEKDEKLATCQLFNAEVCYGSGLQCQADNGKSKNLNCHHHNQDRTLKAHYRPHYCFIKRKRYINQRRSQKQCLLVYKP